MDAFSWICLTYLLTFFLFISFVFYLKWFVLEFPRWSPSCFRFSPRKQRVKLLKILQRIALLASIPQRRCIITARQKPNTQVLLFLFVALCLKTHFEPILCWFFAEGKNKQKQNKAYKHTQKKSRKKKNKSILKTTMESC